MTRQQARQYGLRRLTALARTHFPHLPPQDALHAAARIVTDIQQTGLHDLGFEIAYVLPHLHPPRHP